MSVTTLEEAQQLLYGHPVEVFVTERDALVKEIRAGGDRELANDVKALRKPSAVAAEVNRIVRADPGGVALILQAAALLREVQMGALDEEAVSASDLQTQYRAAIQALAQSADSRRVEVRAALEAATIDVASNEALRTGSLVVVPKPISVFDAASATIDVASNDAPAEQAAPPEDELAKRRALRKESAVEAVADESGTEEDDQEATRQRKAQQKEEAQRRKEEEQRRKEEEKEQERLRKAEEKAREKERQQQKKALKKEHRDALRAHLAALDAEEAATAQVETFESEIAEIEDQLVSLEAAVVAMRKRVADGQLERDAVIASQSEANQAATDAETHVDALAAALDALEEDS